ncbi:aspartic peptidase domain-containing protein, partial [Gigaspora rosea]
WSNYLWHGHPQHFDIQFDTGTGDLFVFGELCDSPACKDKPKYYPKFDQSFIPMFEKDFSIEYADDTKVSGDSGKTTIEIAGISVESQEFGLADNVTGNFNYPYVGIMGMAFSESSENNQITPITNLIDNNQLDKPQFSFLIGRDKSPSELTIGGSSPDKYHADTLTFTHVVDDNDGEWKIPIDNCVIDGEELNLENRTAMIDTGLTLIVMPPYDAKEFYSKITNAIDNEKGSYVLLCEARHEVGLVFNGKTWNIDPKDFIFKQGEGDCIGAVTYYDTGADTNWLIGCTFLKNVYTIFDQGNLQVGFAQLTKN